MVTLNQRCELLTRAQHDKALQAILLEQCQRDPVFWFNHFCWTFNPRAQTTHLPFNLYPYQEKLVWALRGCIDGGEPALIEKSRDMGLSWLVMLLFQWYWLFVPGADAHVGSAKKELVDSRGDKSTLFEKLRYNLQWLPGWMAPTLSREHDTVCKLINPLNGNTITGEAAIADFGRGQRYKMVLLDEFARQPYAQQAYESVSQSTNCVICLFTPYGKANLAYRLAHDPLVERIQLEAPEDNPKQDTP